MYVSLLVEVLLPKKLLKHLVSEFLCMGWYGVVQGTNFGVECGLQKVSMSAVWGKH